MQKLVAGLVSLILFSGCSAPKPAVFVRMESIEQTVSSELAPGSFIAPEVGPTKGAEFSTSIEKLNARPLGFGKAGEMLAEAKGIIEDSRDYALRDLRGRLYRGYLREIDQTENEWMQALGDRRNARLTALTQSLRTLFLDYAEKRTMPLAEKAFLIGHPDFDPKGSKPIESPRFQQDIPKRVDALRKTISDLDRQYEAKRDQLLNQDQATDARDIADLRVRLVRLQVDADRRAEEEAREQFKVRSSDFDRLLANAPGLELPATPGASTTVQVPAPSIRRVPEDGKLENVPAYAQLRAQVEIWATTFGYTLTEDREHGRDATEEFRTWRKRHLNLR